VQEEADSAIDIILSELLEKYALAHRASSLNTENFMPSALREITRRICPLLSCSDRRMERRVESKIHSTTDLAISVVSDVIDKTDYYFM